MSQQTDSRKSGTVQKMFAIMNIGTVPESDSELGFPNLFHQRIFFGLEIYQENPAGSEMI